MHILVTFAVQPEFAPWRRRRRFERIGFKTPGYGSAVYYTAKINNVVVDVFLTGVALRGALQGLPLLLEKKPDICISSGLAGALRPTLRCGEVVVAQTLHKSSPESAAYPQCSNQHLVEIALSQGAKGAEVFLTTDHILNTATAKREAALRGDVVEMESFDVVSLATQKWIPSVAIRSISDGSDEDLPIDFERAVNSKGRIRLSRILIQLLANPGRIGAAIRFGRQSKRAAESLITFLDQYVTSIDVELKKIDHPKSVAV